MSRKKPSYLCAFGLHRWVSWHEGRDTAEGLGYSTIARARICSSCGTAQIACSRVFKAQQADDHA